MNSTKRNDRSGLKMLVYFQRITGQSYRFWNFGNPMDLLLKLVLIFLNIFLFVATLFYSYTTIQDAMNMKKNNESFFSSHQSLIIYIMSISVNSFFSIMNVYVFFLIQFRGKTILVFLHEIDINIESEIEMKIGIKAIILQVTVTLFLALDQI